MKKMRLWWLQPISQAKTISPLQHTSRSRRNAEEAYNSDCGKKIGGLEEGEQTVDCDLSLSQKLSKQVKRDNVMLVTPRATFHS